MPQLLPMDLAEAETRGKNISRDSAISFQNESPAKKPIMTPTTAPDVAALLKPISRGNLEGRPMWIRLRPWHCGQLVQFAS